MTDRRRIVEATRTAAPAARRGPAPARLAELQAQIDARDETIRLLNEALSRALDELAALPGAA